MLTVTDQAAQYLREALTRREEGAAGSLRIVNTEEGYRLTLDDAKDGDQIFEQEGESYLVLDSEVDEALAEATLDVRESPQGMRLKLSEGGATP